MPSMKVYKSEKKASIRLSLENVHFFWHFDSVLLILVLAMIFGSDSVCYFLLSERNQ